MARRIGIVKRYGNQIRLVPLAGGRTTTIDRYSDLLELNWAFDSQSMFVSIQRPGAVVLLHVGLNGEAAVYLAAASVEPRMGSSVA